LARLSGKKFTVREFLQQDPADPNSLLRQNSPSSTNSGAIPKAANWHTNHRASAGIEETQEIKLIRLLRSQDLGLRRIGRILGVSHEKIRQTLKEDGVPVKNPQHTLLEKRRASAQAMYKRA